MRLLLLCCLSVVLAYGVEPEERERLREELSQAMSELAESQERLGDANAGGITIPPGVQVTLTARLTLGQDWIKRIAAPTEFSVEEVDSFREGIYGLRGRIDNVVQQLEQHATLAERFPQSVEKPEFQRYRAYLRSRAEQALLEVAAGGDQEVDDEVHWRRQRRHELILQLSETGDPLERWTLVPKDSQVLREYQDLRAALRAAAETGLQQAIPSNDADLDRDERVLWLLDEQLSLGQGWAERSNDREIPPDAPLLPAYRAAQVAEVKALRALINHQRLMNAEEEAWHRQNDDLRRERDQRARLTLLAWEGLEIDLTILDRRRQLTELMPDAPAKLQTAATTQMTSLAQQRTAVNTKLNQALTAGSLVDALHARSSLRVLSREWDGLIEEFEQDRERAASEQEWRARAGEPGVAAALAKLDAAWAAMAEVRTRQIEADCAAIRAELARELAEAETAVAQHAAERNRIEMDRAREALDRTRELVVDALENPQPKPEGDAKF